LGNLLVAVVSVSVTIPPAVPLFHFPVCFAIVAVRGREMQTHDTEIYNFCDIPLFA